MRKVLLLSFTAFFAISNANSQWNLFGTSSPSQSVEEEYPMVQVFDIAGVILGSSYQYVVEDAVKQSGYKIEKEDTRYPKFFEYNYNYECRKSKEQTPTQIQKCTRDMAAQNKQIYTNYMKLVKDSTGEEVELYFTSNQTENVVYQIIYQNDADKIEGIGEAYDYQRQEKLRRFLLKVYDKFGNPNIVDTENASQIWASDPSNPKKPTMRIYYGKIVIEDLSLFEQDELLSKEMAQKTFKAKDYDF